MAFLEVNGVVINVVDSRREPIRIGGGLDRSSNGAVGSGASATYYEHRFRTGPLSKTASAMYRAIVSGEGHTLGFDSTTTSTSWMWSSRGLLPYHVSGSLDASGKRGPGCMSATTTGTGLKYALGGNNVTVMAWVWFGGSWTHVLKSSANGVETTYVNGVASAATSVATAAVINTFGSLNLIAPASAGGALVRWDEVMSIPTPVTPPVAAQMYAFTNSFFLSQLPSVHVRGDLFDGIDKMRGEIGTIDTVGHLVDGQWEPAGDAFDFVMMETP